MNARRFLISTVAAIASLGLALPAHAASTKVADAVGDANAGNDQGVIVWEDGAPYPNDNSTGPASLSSMDIKSVSFASTFTYKTVNGVRRKVPSALVVTLETVSAPFQSGAVYRVTGDLAQGGDCDTFMLQYFARADGSKTTALRHCDAAAALGYRDTELPAAKVSGNKIVWTIPYATLAKAPIKVAVGAVIKNIGAHDRLATVVTAPQVDQVASTKSYKLGS